MIGRSGRRRWAGWLPVAAVCGLVGCATPPGVERLLAAVDGVLLQETELVRQEAARDEEMLAQARAGLEAGFEADVRGRGALEAEWVLSASKVYAASLVELGRHEARLAEQRRVRLENLTVARQAQGRARELLAQQDVLLGTVGLDLWRLKGRLANAAGEGNDAD